MKDVSQTVISQYSTSPTLREIIESLNGAIDPIENLEDFYRLIWNLDQANEQGLDIWARIVGAQREFRLPAEVKGDYFGFWQGNMFPFNQAPFYSDELLAFDSVRLEGDAFRTAILIKALCNISAADAHSINRVMAQLFGDRGSVYVLDLGNMTMRLMFDFDLTRYEFALMTKSGGMLRPAGVLLDILTIPSPVFGFAEANTNPDPNTWQALPFDVGVFLPPGSHWSET